MAIKLLPQAVAGALLTDEPALAERARHLAATAKCPAGEGVAVWASVHDEVGFNFRMPNLNAALGCAQLQRFQDLLAAKRQLAAAYQTFFTETLDAALPAWRVCSEAPQTEANYWLNTLCCERQVERDALLDQCYRQGIYCRPPWQLLSESLPYRHCQRGDLTTAQSLANTLINLPSTPLLRIDSSD